MRIHYLQHMGCEGLGRIANWAAERGHAVSGTHLYRGDPLPNDDAFDFLVIMGGPMNIYEYRNHPWLTAEKPFIKRAIENGKIVLGVCLGAQLIADVLGAKIHQNASFEIGWFPVRFTAARRSIPAMRDFPEELSVLHWHGDTFDLPPGTVHLAMASHMTQKFDIGATARTMPCWMRWKCPENHAQSSRQSQFRPDFLLPACPRGCFLLASAPHENSRCLFWGARHLRPAQMAQGKVFC